MFPSGPMPTLVESVTGTSFAMRRLCRPGLHGAADFWHHTGAKFPDIAGERRPCRTSCDRIANRGALHWVASPVWTEERHQD
jgi:hypothetical protein